MLLDILIPTLPSRCAYLCQLLKCLSPQLTRSDVSLIVLSDDGAISIGEKRNRLLAKATADYVTMIDDDDLVHPLYVQKIAEGLASGPDCIGFKMRRFYDGIDIGEGINSIRSGGYRNEGYTFYRTPGHLNPIRREIAQRVAYEDLERLEDMRWAAAVLPMLKTEVFVNEHLYEYWYRSPQRRQAEAEGEAEAQNPLRSKDSAQCPNHQLVEAD